MAKNAQKIKFLTFFSKLKTNTYFVYILSVDSSQWCVCKNTPLAVFQGNLWFVRYQFAFAFALMLSLLPKF